MTNAPSVVFSHGQDGDPRGTKIIAMSEAATTHGLRCESIDYRGMADPAARVAKLLAHCRADGGSFILVGSSMGGHVATTVATQVETIGLFLLAPAFYMPGFEQYTPLPPKCPVTVVHGWRDDIVPIDHSVRYGKAHRVTLHAIDSDHRMSDDVPLITRYFDRFLTDLDL
jgi:pimeloyl-ACP methyl ester carboxylesterase